MRDVRLASWHSRYCGLGREGIHEGLPHFLETKFVILEGRPAGYEDTVL
jgi:aldehyde dehydrogenase (NAD+)